MFCELRKGWAGFLFLFLFFSSQAEAQFSTYDRLFGFGFQEPSTSEAPFENRRLKVRFTSRYDDLFRSSSPEQHITLARWWYGTSLDWRISRSQRWHLEFLRAGDVIKVSQSDSSWNFNNWHASNRVRVTHHQALGSFPITVKSFVQFFHENTRAQLNYGLKILWQYNHYKLGLAGEYKSWFPFFQALFNENVQIFFPTQANVREVGGSFAAQGKGVSFSSYFRLGKLLANKAAEKEYSFKPTASLWTFLGTLTWKPTARWRLHLSYFDQRLSGAGVLRYRERKYGGFNLPAFKFYEARLFMQHQLGGSAITFGVAQQKLFADANGNVEAWPYDDASVDFTAAKQSLAGRGSVILRRGWLRFNNNENARVQINLMLEYVKVKTDLLGKTWGSAFLFAHTRTQVLETTRSPNFAKINLAPSLKLSSEIQLNFKISQWIPLPGQNDSQLNLPGKVRGGTIGEMNLAFTFN